MLNLVRARLRRPRAAAPQPGPRAARPGIRRAAHSKKKRVSNSPRALRALANERRSTFVVLLCCLMATCTLRQKSAEQITRFRKVRVSFLSNHSRTLALSTARRLFFGSVFIATVLLEVRNLCPSLFRIRAYTGFNMEHRLPCNSTFSACR